MSTKVLLSAEKLCHQDEHNHDTNLDAVRKGRSKRSDRHTSAEAVYRSSPENQHSDQRHGNQQCAQGQIPAPTG